MHSLCGWWKSKSAHKVGRAGREDRHIGVMRNENSNRHEINALTSLKVPMSTDRHRYYKQQIRSDKIAESCRTFEPPHSTEKKYPAATVCCYGV